MAKQYKTWELIKAWQEGERGKFEGSGSLRPVHLENGGIYIEGNPFYLSSADFKAIWTKVQEPVDFMTAVNSRLKIKPFRSDLSYNSISFWFQHIGLNYPPHRIIEILEDKWLIEDGE